MRRWGMRSGGIDHFSHILLSNTDVKLTTAIYPLEARLKTQLDAIRDRYEYVMIDCPPRAPGSPGPAARQNRGPNRGWCSWRQRGAACRNSVDGISSRCMTLAYNAGLQRTRRLVQSVGSAI